MIEGKYETENTETDRQADRQTDRQTDRPTEGEDIRWSNKIAVCRTN